MDSEGRLVKILDSVYQVVVCNNCGTRLRFGDYECPHCGTDVEEPLRSWAIRLLTKLET